jgi:hypothetical protein
MSIKPYFQSENTSNNKLNKLETPLPTLELTLEPIKPAKPIIPPPIKRGQGRLKKNPVTKSHLTSIDILIKKLPPIDISVLI